MCLEQFGPLIAHIPPSTLKPQSLFLPHFHPLSRHTQLSRSLSLVHTRACKQRRPAQGRAGGGRRTHSRGLRTAGERSPACARWARERRRHAQDGAAGVRRLGRAQAGTLGERRWHAQAAAGERRRRVQAAAGEPWRRRAGWAGGLACRWVRWAGPARSSDLRIVPRPLARPMNQHDTTRLT